MDACRWCSAAWLLLLLDVLFSHSGFSFWLYLLPYGLLYYAAVQVYRQGLQTARYFLLAHALVAVSLVFLIMRKLGIEFFNNALHRVQHECGVCGGSDASYLCAGRENQRH